MSCKKPEGIQSNMRMVAGETGYDYRRNKADGTRGRKWEKGNDLDNVFSVFTVVFGQRENKTELYRVRRVHGRTCMLFRHKRA